jgi:hypothetical protein
MSRIARFARAAILVSAVAGGGALLFFAVTNQVEQSRKFAVAGAGVALIGTALMWQLPKWQVAGLGLSVETRFDKENEARKTLAQILGGLAIIGSFYGTVRTLETSQLQATIASEQLSVARNAQIVDHFTKAVSQLQDNRLEVRLGGIYALGGIAQESTENHWPIMEVLTAYVRRNAPFTDGPGKILRRVSKTTTVWKVPEDIRAVLTVIGQRAEGRKEGELNLSFCDLRNADFRELNLRGIFLEGTRLEGSTFGEAHLEGAYLGSARLNNTVLEKTHLEGADLTDVEGLTQEQLDAAIGDGDTILPQHVHRPKHWMK